MIGLVDLHWQQAADLILPPPNLEIMKLAEYYKNEENIPHIDKFYSIQLMKELAENE